jgi:hypothetical protein
MQGEPYVSTHPLLEYYRCPEGYLDIQTAGVLQAARGYFRCGQEVLCYGHTAGDTCPHIQEPLFDALPHISSQGCTLWVPFDPAEVVDNLRYERYVGPSGNRPWRERSRIKALYYLLRPLVPVALRKHVQQVYLRGWEAIPFPAWPVDRSVDRLLETLLGRALHALALERLPFIWFWPEGQTACAIVTHDVEERAGQDFTARVMDLDDAYGIKASFQLVPEKRYPVSPAYLETIRARGFEINVQGLDHSGWLFRTEAEFCRSAEKINRYGKEFRAQGFRAPIMHRNIDWFTYLDFAYDMSVPTVAHLEPQRGGCCTVMPYFLPSGMLELPLTTVQDYSLFHIAPRLYSRPPGAGGLPGTARPSRRAPGGLAGVDRAAWGGGALVAGAQRHAASG